MRKIRAFTKHQRRCIQKKNKRHLTSKLKQKLQRYIKYKIKIPKRLKNKFRKLKKHRKSRCLRVTAPRVLGFYDKQSRSKLMTWLSNIRNLVEVQNKRIFINFTHSKNPEAAGVLRTLAEIDRLQQIRGSKYIQSNTPLHTITAQALEQIGLLKMLSSKQRPKPTHAEVIYWQFTCGTNIDASKAGQLIERLLDIAAIDAEIIGTMIEGINEAMTNTIMHAYDPKFKDWHSHEQRWWMFAGVKDSNFILLMCDVGLGIPNSLDLKHDATKLKSMIQLVTDTFGLTGKDSRCIKVSMEIGRSSSNLDHRGLGMAQLKAIIDTMKAGSLFIYSNYGQYTYNYTNDKVKEQLFEFENSIEGTIVGWKIPLNLLKLLSLDTQK